MDTQQNPSTTPAAELSAKALLEAAYKVDSHFIRMSADGAHLQALSDVMGTFMKAELPITENLPRQTGDDGNEYVDFPADGYGVAVVPRYKRLAKGEKMTLTGLFLAICPQIDTVMAHEGGVEWCNDKIFDALFDEVRRPGRADDVKGSDFPKTVQDYITRATKGTGLTAWRKVGPTLLEALQAQVPALKEWNVAVLKSVLESAKIANTYAPKVGQDTWVGVINAGKQLAEREGEDGRIFDTWLENRDKEAEIELEGFTFDFGDDANADPATQPAA